MNDELYWTTASQVCTTLEIQTLRLRDRGLSLRQISLALNISVSTVRSRLFNSDRKIQIAIRSHRKEIA